MAVKLDHTIIDASNNLASARFLADILGIPQPVGPGHFAPVVTDNDVALDFMTVGKVLPHHYAFTLSSAAFDAAHGRMRTKGLTIYAQPDRSGKDEMYERDGRRGFYFDDPDSNLMELIERPRGEAESEVRELATRWAAAEVNGDVEALDRLLAEEFCGIGPLGFVLDKAAWLKRFAGGLHHAAMSFDELRVHAHGDTLIVAAVLEQQTTFNDLDASGRYRVSFVVVRAGDCWQIASCHIGSLVAGAKAS